MSALPPPSDSDRVDIPPPLLEDRVELTRSWLTVAPWVVVFVALFVAGVLVLT